MVSKRASGLVVVAVLSVVVITGFTLPSQAQEIYESGRSVADLLEEVRTSQTEPGISVISTNRPAFAVLIPAAGNTTGNAGTHFKTDLYVMNFRSTQQRIEVAWMPMGGNNCSRSTSVITLNTGWRAYEDFVGRTLNTSGLGSLLLVGITSGGAVDSSARIDANSRIWTPNPTKFQGTVSLPFPGVNNTDLTGNVRSYILGLRQDGQFRTNIGIVNLSTTAQRFQREVYGTTNPGPATNQVEVPGCSMVQEGAPAGTWGNLLASVVPLGNPVSWSAYGASVDNLTGDGWIVQAIRE